MVFARDFADRVERVRVEVARHERAGRLMPGASEKLAALWGPELGGYSEQGLAEAVARKLTLESVRARWSNPEYVPPAAPNGAPASALRLELLRRAGELKPGAVEQLMTAWGGDLGGLPADRLAGEVARRLASREVAQQFTLSAPPASRAERRLSAILREHFGELPESARAELARSGAETRGGPADAVVRALAQDLSVPAIAARCGVGPLAADDWRLKASHRTVTEPELGEAAETPSRSLVV